MVERGGFRCRKQRARALVYKVEAKRTMSRKADSPIGSRKANQMSKPTTQGMHPSGTAAHLKSQNKSIAVALNEPRHSAAVKPRKKG